MKKYPDFFAGENHHSWNGGRIKRRGYIFIHSPNLAETSFGVALSPPEKLECDEKQIKQIVKQISN